MIINEFNTPSHTVRITPGLVAVDLEIDQSHFDLPWDKLNDVEYLAAELGRLRVMDFCVIVKELGIVYKNKNLYEALLG
jgi:hypothetical protein